MREARTNQPVGRRFNEAFGKWLALHGFERLDKGDRSRLIECLRHRAEIEAWRSTLPLNKRLALNHPSAVIRCWKASTLIPTAKVSAMAKLRTAHVEVIEENHRLKQEIERGGGDVWTSDDKPADIANIMASKLSIDKLERTARAMLAIAAKRREDRKTTPAANVAATPRHGGVQ
jgi:hypothetical protein